MFNPRKSVNFTLLKTKLIQSASMCKINQNNPSVQAEPELFKFPQSKKSVECSFTAPDLSSNGGLLLLSQVESQCGFLGNLASLIKEWRNEDLLVHDIATLVKQRVMQIAAGFEDADDCDRLRNDKALKLSIGRTPNGIDLASQPTMTRLENHVGRDELYAIGNLFVDNFLDSYKFAPESIVVDLDDTNANTYGAQQLTLFNTHYGEKCYMPLLAFDAVTGRLILPMLRPGRVNKRANVGGLLKRLVLRIRERWPKTVIILRGDGHFCSHTFMTWANKQEGVKFITGLAGNSVLYDKVEHLVETAADMYKKEGKDVKLYTRFYYKAKSWERGQFVIAKVEYTAMGSNVRFIVTNILKARSKDLYENIYCKRGVCELYIKELKTCLKADRMSCNSFCANQFRLFLHSAAYVLLLQTKEMLFSDTELAGVSILTFRERVILSAVRITEMKTKIKVEFQNDHAMRAEMEQALRIAVGWKMNVA